MNISAPFIHRPVMTTFVMIAILLAGCIAYQQLPISDLPSMELPNIYVTAGYRGANPETVLNEVTIPLEKELASVKGVKEMTSKSAPGFSSITLKFDLNKNMNEAIRDVQSAINRAESHLPSDLEPRPSYQRDEGDQDPIMHIIMSSDNSNLGALHTYAEAYILPRLKSIEGVSQINIFGSGSSIWLRLNPELMAARKIGFNEVIDAIRSSTTQMPLGTIQTGNKSLAIELSTPIQQAKDLENIKIGKSSVRIKDIGEISETSTRNKKFHFVTSEETFHALRIAVQKINDANTVAVSKGVQEVLAGLKAELPPSIHLNLWLDKAVWIRESIVDVEWTLIFAFFLVILVIYLSLGKISEALVPSLALPMSLLGTFAVMYLLNFSLDLLSLLALTLSVGFVVDDAIVVLENIIRHQERGETPLQASLNGSKQICFTILSMTLSLVAVFIPLLFMPGINGRLFREFSITLAVAILVSGFISLTLTPMVCSRFLLIQSKKTWLQRVLTDANTSLTTSYGKTLRSCFKYPKTILLLAFLCIGVSFPLFKQLSIKLLPEEDRGFLIAFVNLPPSLPQDEIEKYQEKIESLIQSNAYIKNFLSMDYDGNLLFVIKLLSIAQRPEQQTMIAEIQNTINAVPGTQVHIQGYQLINLDLDLGNGGQYKYLVRGFEFQDVEEAVKKLTDTLKSHPEFSYIKSSIKNESPILVVDIDEERIHKLGLNKHQVQQLLLNAFGQGPVATLQKGANRDKLFMELLPEFQNSPQALSKLHFKTIDGSFVPLKAVAQWTEKQGAPNFSRRDQLASASIRFSLIDEISPNEGLEKMEKIASETLPSNVTGSLDGSAKAISTTLWNTILLLIAATIVMYIVLGILYENFLHPLTILSSLPFAGLGGVLTLYLFDEPLSLFSAVGFLLLIGIVKKNGIMVVDYALEAQKKGVSPSEAIYEGCLVRFRPIIMTTIAAIMGALPIAIGFGEGAEMRRGLGLVIVGGLLFSQILTLYVTPIIYLTFEKLRKTQNCTSKS